MQQAWNQLGAVQAANRLQALTELAAAVADRLHVRHTQNLTPSQLISVAAPARTRVLVAPASTLQASTAATPLAPGTGTVAFSRFARPLGPIGIRAFNRVAPTVIANGISGAVTVTPPPAQLDGITALMPAPAIPAGATGITIGRGWQNVTTIEQNIPPVVADPVLRQAVNQGIKPVTGLGLEVGKPILLVFPPPPAPAPPSLTDTLTAALQPSIGIYKRYGGRVSVPPQLNSPGDPSTIPIRVMAYPQFTAPLALALIKNHLEWIVPGLGNFPDNSVTLMETNGAFVESFLVGANHEMNRLLLWREYPTDQRGTPFQYFWPRPDRSPDIPPITNWDITTPLGSNAADGPDLETMLVLLVRGEVLQRYPQTMVYAAPGIINGTSLTLDTNSADWVSPEFLMRIDAKTTALAFPLTVDAVKSNFPAGIGGYYFVFSEPVSGPRFNFDVNSSVPLQHWNDLGWDQAPQARGFAVAGQNLAIAPPALQSGVGDPRWNNDSADTARIAFAQPYRVGYHADQLLGSL